MKLTLYLEILGGILIPPSHFVNHSLTSATPTILKGQTVGLTHHTLYETHRNLLSGGILTTKFDTRNPEPHVCFMNMATLCESYGLVVMESASGHIAQCMTQHCDRSDMTHGQKIFKRRLLRFMATHTQKKES